MHQERHLLALMRGQRNLHSSKRVNLLYLVTLNDELMQVENILMQSHLGYSGLRYESHCRQICDFVKWPPPLSGGEEECSEVVFLPINACGYFNSPSACQNFWTSIRCAECYSQRYSLNCQRRGYRQYGGVAQRLSG